MKYLPDVVRDAENRRRYCDVMMSYSSSDCLSLHTVCYIQCTLSDSDDDKYLSTSRSSLWRNKYDDDDDYYRQQTSAEVSEYDEVSYRAGQL